MEKEEVLTQEEAVSPFTLVDLGVSLANEGVYEEAEKEFRRAIRIDPDMFIAHYNYGVILGRMNRLKEAENAYKKAIELAPKIGLAQNNLGIILTKSRKYEEAEETYRDAIKKLPSTSPYLSIAHLNLGKLLCDLRRYDEAEIEYNEAKRLDPNLKEAYVNLGNLYVEQEAYKEAKKEYKQALEIDYQMPNVHNNLGVVLAKLNMFEEAKAEFEQVIKLDSAYARTHHNLRELKKIDEISKPKPTPWTTYFIIGITSLALIEIFILFILNKIPASGFMATIPLLGFLVFFVLFSESKRKEIIIPELELELDSKGMVIETEPIKSDFAIESLIKAEAVKPTPAEDEK
jgi:tetratricopeptide (TPR) repeat protein